MGSRSIFVNTVPKSGSVFIETTLRDIFGYEHITLGTGYFPNDTILLEQARKFREGGFSAQQHADCGPNNIALLEKYVVRWVIHLRDPRSVALSWTHHLNKFVQLNQHWMLDYSAPIPDENYLNLSFSEKLDWQIANFLPHVVKWIGSWLNYADRNPDRVLVTTYEEMSADNKKFFQKLLTFFSSATLDIGDVSRFRSEATHFRKGEIDEWRRAFSSEQKARALETIPSTLQKRMNWPAL